ncbi:MAG: hypothetical protein P8L68_04540 [Paracoccaceae bacterium]|nr:hypothetical protein [Paracoccaceae bacterium]MDG2257745.1 hypothetical protein [Paracoccaceae bacterium]
MESERLVYRSLAMCFGVLAFGSYFLDFSHYIRYTSSSGSILVDFEFVFDDVKWLIIFVFTLLSLTLFFQPNKTFVKCFDYFYYSLLACGLFLGVTVSSDRFEAYYNNSQWQTLYDLIEDISLGCESLLLFDENFQSNSFNNVANICWDLEEFTELDPRFELLSKRKIGESLIKLSDVFQTFIGAYERLSLTAPNLAAHEDIIVWG